MWPDGGRCGPDGGVNGPNGVECGSEDTDGG